MSASLEKLVRDLREFEGRKEVLKQLRQKIRQPVPAVRKAIRQRAIDTLPEEGGLNLWAAAIRITVQFLTGGRNAGVKLRGGRNSSKKRSDVRALDRGRVRHPSWGRRYAGQWHNQKVEPGFVTVPVTEAGGWHRACVEAVDEAIEVIGRD